MTTDFNQQHALAQDFIQCYLAARQGLKKLGILRSERNLQGDYAEWLVAQRLELRLAPTTIQKAIDATDKQGRTYQIKSRMVRSLTASTSFDFSTLTTKFDWLVCVFFSVRLELLGIVRVPYNVVRELGIQNGPADFRFRWNRRVSQDARIEKLFWKEGDDKLSVAEVE